MGKTIFGGGGGGGKPKKNPITIKIRLILIPEN